jgi:transcription elongation factor Elf1
MPKRQVRPSTRVTRRAGREGHPCPTCGFWNDREAQVTEEIGWAICNACLERYRIEADDLDDR